MRSQQIIDSLISLMVKYFSGDPKRIQHLIKVHSFAALIGRGEVLSEREQFILEAAAVVHDIGIKLSEEKYGSACGKYQELEGPAEAEKLLRKLDLDSEAISRISFLVGHHHTYNAIDGIDHRILVEADFLVNLYEDSASPEAVKSAYDKVFRTETGRMLFCDMFALKGGNAG